MNSAAILFLVSIVLVVVVLVSVKQGMRKKNSGKILEQQRAFWDMVRRNVNDMIPETAGFDFVLAGAVKDLKSSIAGYERIKTGYESMPIYILCYSGDDIYITAVKCPSVKSMIPDHDFILHVTPDCVAKVEEKEIKVAFYFKPEKQFIAMYVEGRAISGIEQFEESRQFHEYIKGFAERVRQANA